VAIVTDTLRLESERDVLGAWAEVRTRLGALAVQAGLRAEHAAGVTGAAPALSPRVTARLEPSADLALAVGYGRTLQFTQAVAPAGPPIGPDLSISDVWLVAGDTVPALRADIVTAGIEAWLGTRWLLTANVYRRDATGVAVPDPRPGPTAAAERPAYVLGRNTAQGLEAGLRRMVGRWTASVAWTIGRSRMEAASLVYPAAQDRRHVLDATGLVRVSDRVRVGGAVTAASGTPFARYQVAFVETGFADTLVLASAERLEGPNAGRTPAYLSADLFAEWQRPVGGAELNVFVQVRNVLGGENAVTYRGSGACDVTGYVLRPRTDGGGCDWFNRGLPLLPVVGIRVTF
jgi:hypothetical protein